MKTIRALSLVIAVLALTASASAETRGWGVGVGVHDSDFGFQLRKDFWLGGDVSQITGQASVFLHGKTTFKLDTDYHFIINPGNPSRFYPLAGLQLAFNSDKVKLGINLGGGLSFRLTPKTAAFAEAKFVFGDWDGFGLMGGIYF
jgi:hypothetical protein